jgi:HD-GYP domain-containing protein (c-di-GMP phosphodiesterase class II)
MNEKQVNDQISSHHKVLLIGSLSDFENDIQQVLKRHQLQVTSIPPDNYHLNDYSVIIVSPKSEAFEFKPFANKRFFVLSFSEKVVADIQINKPFSCYQFSSVLASAIEFYKTKSRLRETEKQHLIVSKERTRLSEIGVALSAEKDLNKLLSMVLKEGRSLGKCEGASLYLMEKNELGEPELLFKLTQNSKVDFDFQEMRFALTSDSLAGYVALNGEILNIRDVYQLDKDLPYSFDKSFDLKIGYRSKELLVLPMKNHKGNIIGVLQFVNTFGNDNLREIGENSEVGGFSLAKQGLLAGLASQAAVAIDNSQLIENIQNLFEGFVSASVNAIESRDPVTSGHSFRVAELTTNLAKMLDRESNGRYKHLTFNAEQLKEIRYASLLHDFGKVGVKENVLLKANKLHASRFQYIALKIEWQKQLLQKRFYQQLLTEGVSLVGESFNTSIVSNPKILESNAYKDLQKQLTQLDQYQQTLTQANRPSVLEQEVVEELSQMASYQMNSEFPFNQSLINDSDFLSLSISKGSLTQRERKEIQSHVVYTQAFLARIPWTDELSAIPTIAGAHHEKLDGSGYPLGLIETEIPVASKVMTIADIFDALTAQDRPYKKAINYQMALDILSDEAKKGKVDQQMLNTFIQAEVYRCVLS